MNLSVLNYIKKDSVEHGFGRKAWWAKQIGVPPLTISHWLRGRQKPNGVHTQKILALLEELSFQKQAPAWIKYLWTFYYHRAPLEKELLPWFIINILRSETIEVRTFALMSSIVEKFHIDFWPSPMATERLMNRIGWLLEISNRIASFKPQPKEVDLIFPFAEKMRAFPEGRNYLTRHQTRIGRRWFIYDCDLSQIKKTLIWTRATNKLLAS